MKDMLKEIIDFRNSFMTSYFFTLPNTDEYIIRVLTHFQKTNLNRINNSNLTSYAMSLLRKPNNNINNKKSNIINYSLNKEIKTIIEFRKDFMEKFNITTLHDASNMIIELINTINERHISSHEGVNMLYSISVHPRQENNSEEEGGSTGKHNPLPVQTTPPRRSVFNRISSAFGLDSKQPQRKSQGGSRKKK
jgi:hypothetical protein